MKLKKTCPLCNKTKYFWEFFGNTCKECNVKSHDEYYENMSREELLKEIKYSKNSKEETPWAFLCFMGNLIAFMYYQYIENPHIFSSSFWGNTEIVLGHLVEAISFVILSFVAAIFFYIAYLAATHKFESKAGKITAIILLIIGLLFFYISLMTD